MQIGTNSCPLCRRQACTPFATTCGRNYFECPICALVFMDPINRLPPEHERARYDLHQNDPSNQGYVDHLQPVVSIVEEHVPKGSRGLDFGCGSNAVLADLLEQIGYVVERYDPFFAANEELLTTTYDFIVCVEVVEHFYNPEGEFELLWKLLSPGGILVLKTETLSNEVNFVTWWYPRDATHVVLYRDETFEWIARHWGWEAGGRNGNTRLFRRLL